MFEKGPHWSKFETLKPFENLWKPTPLVCFGILTLTLKVVIKIGTYNYHTFQAPGKTHGFDGILRLDGLG
jgi:hypothetical protein